MYQIYYPTPNADKYYVIMICTKSVQQYSEFAYNKQILMKKLHQSFDKDSHSTQQKQRRFNRKSTSRSPNSTSSKSKGNSLSKFYIRSLNTSNSGKDIAMLLTTAVMAVNIGQNNSQEEGKGRALETGSVTARLTRDRDNDSKESKGNQIKQLRVEIEKYQKYVQKQNQKYNQIKKRNEQLERVVKEIIRNKEELDAEVEKLRAKIAQKDVLINILQKQQPSLQKTKTAIIQMRALQFQKEKQELNKKIRQLQTCVQTQKSKNCPQLDQYPVLNTVRSCCPKYQTLELSKTGSVTERTSNYCSGFDNVQDLQRQLYESKEEVSRLQMSSACMQRKYFKQMETLRQKKQKQYEQLKKKFTQLLQKYRVNMKKITTNQFNKIKQCRPNRLNPTQKQHVRSLSKDSIDSLIFSSDQQKQREIQHNKAKIAA